MKLLKKIFKVTLLIFGIVFLILYGLFWYYTTPKSDADILKAYSKSFIKPTISKEQFNDFEYRKVTIIKDTTLPYLVFVHGTIGSVNDFNRYLSDSLLQKKFNFIAYDRIGYNFNDKNNVQESIAFEREMLKDIIKNLPPEKTILVGYSYGGPIVLSIKNKVHKTILLAPAAYSKVEPIPWMVNLYKFPFTRWLIPPVWKQASKEKLSHQEDLENFENEWNTTPNNVISIHGTKDWIVPISNSIFLQSQFSSEKFKLIKIDDAGHDLIWSNFDEIKKLLIQNAD
ncbi:alpha/beta fold hydrolase [Tenacibaculum holothuriorum]|uniref:alpha/beta fold hydrolase n=1 Tax=Tenacibaculum holothuriorum TaxID=1635173 RepID=UPI000A329356|nr:alpha/beta fold hydrolase [Tenacibaculum holothuriorum]